MTSSEPRMSGPTLKVLKLFLTDIGRQLSGADITKEARVGAGTLYPLLDRLEKHGWLTSTWEDVDPSAAGRPRRRLYRLTGVGQTAARRVFQDLQLDGDPAWI